MTMVDIKKLKVNIYYNQPLGPKAMAKLREDIRLNGVREPLLIEKNNTIIDGMIRYKIAKEFGFQQLPCEYIK